MDTVVTLCIPTLVRYDLLAKLIQTAEIGSFRPAKYLIVDNGGGFTFDNPRVEIYKPGHNIGVAASWNWLIDNSDEVRIICNDDILFFPNTIGDFVHNIRSGICSPDSIIKDNAFSMFSISDDIVEKIGYFDETISPNWAYFEDNDYARRLQLASIPINAVQCYVGHHGSATLKHLTPQQEAEHHEKFKAARAHYTEKWGGEPGREVYKTAYNK